MHRRSLLKLGLVSAAVLGVAGGGAALLYEPAWHEGRLTPVGRRVLAAVARGVLDGSLPRTASAAEAVMSAHLDRMNVTLQALSPATQRELGDLLALLAFPPGRVALAGLADDWASAEVADIQAALQAMRSSRLALRQQAYHALRDLTHAAFFADASHWAQLGYPGPVPVG